MSKMEKFYTIQIAEIINKVKKLQRKINEIEKKNRKQKT